jgi:hypothetical protein
MTVPLHRADEPIGVLLADEQAALRRVATLVAGGARPAEVFSAVADELGHLIGAEATFVSRVDRRFGERGDLEEYITVVGAYGRVGDRVPIGFRLKPATGDDSGRRAPHSMRAVAS